MIVTNNGQTITAEIHEGVVYYTTERRGVVYTAFRESIGSWWVASHRKSLGPWHIGGGRRYETLADLAAGCKAFADLPEAIELEAAC